MKLVAVALCAAVLAIASAVAPADAAQKKKSTATTAKSQTIIATRPRTRITVRRTARRLTTVHGLTTEQLPGERKFMDYVMPPGYSPSSVIDNKGGHPGSSALPGPFDLPGRRNPWPWHWCSGC
jgi:hypothetical protein